VENTFGLEIRNDWIHNGLLQTKDCLRKDKLDISSGTSLPATTQADLLRNMQVGFYVGNKIQWTAKYPQSRPCAAMWNTLTSPAWLSRPIPMRSLPEVASEKR
jgi:hypothetical protein